MKRKNKEEQSEPSDGSYYSDSESETSYTSDELEEKIDSYLPIIVMNNYNTEECYHEENPKKKQKLSSSDEQMLAYIRNLSVDGEKSILERILNSKFSNEIKKKLIDGYDEKEHSPTEKSKFSLYVEKVLKLPVGKTKKINPNVDNISKFMANLRKNLDDAIAGHSETKSEIIDHITSMLRNPNANSNILALHSPAGLGKTRFVRALGKALGLPFAQISFGGLNDPSLLSGHDYTYIGSKPGKIYDILCKSGYMNGVVMLDEIDKIGDLESSKTREVNGVLTHLLDKEQNCEFYDHYIGHDIPLDLSKILFIASFNNEYNVDPIVLNRLKVIKIKENTLKEKIEIVRKFSIPEITKNLLLEEYKIVVSDNIIKYVILNKTIHEPGMRNIIKNFRSLFSKINTMLYLEKTSKEDLQNITKDLVYENVFLTRDGVNNIIVTTELVDKFIPKKTSAMELNMMYN
jgi:ATP-dependent Lon protease